jgi:hypothetical protein
MSEQEQIIINLQQKARKIVSNYTELKEEHQKLQNEKIVLQQALKNKDAEIKVLQDKYNNLKLAKALIGDSDERYDAKAQITKIVRDIDKCIALLNR